MESNGHRISILDSCRVGSQYFSQDETGYTTTDFQIRCVNKTSRNIWWKSRIGVDCFMPAMEVQTGFHDEHVEVQLSWKMPANAWIKTIDEFTRCHSGQNELLRFILAGMDERFPNHAGMNKQTSAITTIQIKLGELEKVNGITYVEELDISFVVDSYQTRQVEHPFSPNERVRKTFEGVVPHISSKTLVFSLKAVQNGPERMMADRYVSLGGEVYKVPIEKDKGLEDGVHFVCRNSAEAIHRGEDRRDVVHEHLSFDEADQRFGMKLTSEEAKIIGNVELQQKIHLSKITHEQKVEEVQMRKEFSDRDMFAADEKEGRERRRIETETHKEHAKNLGDWIRLVTQFTAVAIGAFKTLAKLKPA